MFVLSLQDELGELNDQEQMLTKQVNNVDDSIDCGAQGLCVQSLSDCGC